MWYSGSACAWAPSEEERGATVAWIGRNCGEVEVPGTKTLKSEKGWASPPVAAALSCSVAVSVVAVRSPPAGYAENEGGRERGEF